MVSAAHLLEMLPLTTGGTILHHTFLQTEEQMRFLLQGGKEGRRKDESEKMMVNGNLLSFVF